MAKALKIVGTVVAVVGIVATAGALAFPAVAATATTAATAGGFLGLSAATLGTIGTIASLAAAGIGLASAVLMPKPSFSTAGNPLDFQTNPQSGLPYAIGRTRMSGLRIHGETYDGTAYKSEGKDDVLAFAVMLSAGGPIEEIEKFRADKEEVTFNSTTGMATGGYADWMAQKVSLGLAGASALALAFGGGNFPGWTADHKLSGIAHALWDLRGDPKGEHFGAGVPEPEWIGKWVKVYDPRLDSTYPGGSGSHRALDESTYEWSANPALHALTWALGRWQNGKRTLGIGAPVENIRIADFVEAANVADANDWTCGGVEWSTDSKWTILKRMLQAGGAEPTMTGAMIGCRVNTPRVSIATVEAGELLDNASFPMTRSRRDRFNSVIPRYRSEDHDWEVVSGSLVTVPLYVEEDGGQRTKEIDFPLVQHEVAHDGNKQAGELAAYEIVNSREAGPWRFTVGPKFIGIKTGDVITLNVPDEGIDEQPVLVRSRSIDPSNFKITFEVETETTAKHDFALGKTTVPPSTYQPTPPNLTPPMPSAALWSLTEGATADGVPALIVEGVCEFPGADSVIIEYRKVGDTAWINQGKFEASAPVKHFISPVDGDSEYSARIAYQSGSRVGPWLVLGAVTTPEAVTHDPSANDRNALVPDAPAFDGDPYVTRVDGPTGLVSVAADVDVVYNPDPAHKNNYDRLEFGYFIGTDATPHTMLGDGTEGEVWGRMAPQATGTVSPNFFTDKPATVWATFGARAARDVHTDVPGNVNGVIYSPIAQVGPFQPYSEQEMGGVNIELIAASVIDYNSDNDANGETPPAATGVTLSGMNFSDASGRTIVSWTYTTSSDPAADNNIDGFLVGLYVSDSSDGYTYNSADDNDIWWQEVTADLRSTSFNTPVDQYCTGIVIPFRRVRATVDADGVVRGTAAQSSAVTPFQQSEAPNFTGLIDSETAANIKIGSAKARVAINDDNNISTARVLKDSILVDAINEADWIAQGFTITFGTSETQKITYVSCTSRGGRLVIQLILDYQMNVLDPTAGSEVNFTVKLMAKRVSTGTEYFSDTITLSEVWNSASATGVKNFSRKTVALEATFDGLPTGAFEAGWQISTNSTCGVNCRGYRWLRVDDKGAAQ